MNKDAISKYIKHYPGFIFEFNALINAIPDEWLYKLRNLTKDTLDKVCSTSSTNLNEITKYLI